MIKDETLEGKFEILDAIKDSTFGNKHYEKFMRDSRMYKIKFTSLSNVFNLPLDGHFCFAKDKNGLYLTRSIDLDTDDEWTAAIIKEKSHIAIIKYPSLLEHYVDTWIKEHKKEFSCYDASLSSTSELKN